MQLTLGAGNQREASGEADSLRKGVSPLVQGSSVTKYVMGLNPPPCALSVHEESGFPSGPQQGHYTLPLPWGHVGTILEDGWLLIQSMCLPTWSSRMVTRVRAACDKPVYSLYLVVCQ